MRSWTVWITGLPGSGKSTIARRLHAKLNSRRVTSHILSTDDLRKVMTPKSTYSEEERERVYSTAVYIARTLNENGVNVILDGTGNLRKYRDLARRELRKMAIVYARCPLELCVTRERWRRRSRNAPSDIYQKGTDGRSTTVPGINVPYEEPLDAEVVVNSGLMGASECADKILSELWNCFF